MKVLIATDGADCSSAAIEAAARLLRLEDMDVSVVSVAPTTFMLTNAGVYPYVPPQAQDELDQMAHQALESARGFLHLRGVCANYVFRTGEPAEEILRLTESLRPDLLVLGSHGRGRFGRLLMGSVSDAVAHRWHGPVLIARMDEEATDAPSAERRVRDVMTPDPRCATPDTTLQEAARLMREADTGLLPVLEGDAVRGVITDRDLVVRATAQGVDPATGRVGDFMTVEVDLVHPDTDMIEAIRHMEGRRIRRLLVCDRGRLVGVLSLGDLAECEASAAKEVLVEISKSPKTLAHTRPADKKGASR
jgi:CBS domain-containing protein/nucleotide-binding universal stress UspA family protein